MAAPALECEKIEQPAFHKRNELILENKREYH